MPGSSGSGVFNEAGEISGLVFAGSAQGLSYGFIVPLESVKDFITKEYNLEEDIIPDIVSLCRWFPGMEQPPHADDMTNSDVKGFEHRVFGAIIYLNDNYEGGKTFYPGHGIEITPKAGLLAVHPGDPEHLHGVTKIEGTVRYTIASFWTYDTTKSYVLSAH
jgi:hypothetical protein